MDLKEVGCKNMKWIYVIQDRFQLQAHVNMVMDFTVPKFSEFLDYSSG
jgi:hypothetical protein